MTRITLIDEYKHKRLVEYIKMGAPHSILAALFKVSEATIDKHVDKARKEGDLPSATSERTSFASLVKAHEQVRTKSQPDDFDQVLLNLLYEKLVQDIAFPYDILDTVLSVPPDDGYENYHLLFDRLFGIDRMVRAAYRAVKNEVLAMFQAMAAGKLSCDQAKEFCALLQVPIFNRLRRGEWGKQFTEAEVKIVHDALKTLQPIEEQVLTIRFGLGRKPKSLKETATLVERPGRTSERMRQIEADALRKLRDPSLRLAELADSPLQRQNKRASESRELQAELERLRAEKFKMDVQVKRLKVYAPSFLLKEPSDIVDQLSQSIDELNLSTRAYTCLKSANLNTVYDVIIKTDRELLGIPHFGKKSLHHLKKALSKFGLTTGMKIGISKEKQT